MRSRSPSLKARPSLRSTSAAPARRPAAARPDPRGRFRRGACRAGSAAGAAGAVISGEVTDASTETATLSSRRVPPIRASIAVRSARHRCRDLGQIVLALGGVGHQLHRQRHPIQLRPSSSSSRGSAAKPGPATATNSRRASASGSGLIMAKSRHRSPAGRPVPRELTASPSLRDRGDGPQQLLHRQRIGGPRGLEVIQHHHAQPRPQRRAHPVSHAARPVPGHAQLGSQPRQQRLRPRWRHRSG